MMNGQFGQTLCEPMSIGSMEEQSDALLLQRFARQQDQTAFTALVKRHGPMVLAVCRRVLRNTHDADDAFQATFLVLVRKAAAIARPELLGNWLYGVAYRVSVKARANAARRAEHERRAPVLPLEDPLLDVTGRELRAVLDAEMSRLPEKYRAPLVLCYLEGKTNEEAARLLGWPTGSMSGRLARARELLRKRLVHRGLALSAGVFALLLSRNSAAAAIPDSLLRSTVRGAVWFARAKPMAASIVSPARSARTGKVSKAAQPARWTKKLLPWIALPFLVVSGRGALWLLQKTPTADAAVAPSVSALADEVSEAMRLARMRKKVLPWMILIFLAVTGAAMAYLAYAPSHAASCHVGRVEDGL